MTEPRPPLLSVATLGCKVNQYESREATLELLRRGYHLVPAGHPADVCLVNTCTVTHEADVKSRAALRRAARTAGEPLVVATGCYVETAPADVAALSGVAAVVPNEEKPRLAEIVEDLVRRSGRLLFPLPEAPDAAPPVAADGSGGLIRLLRDGEGAVARTRAVIKIQDGCNHYCSFCIIPFTRGRLRSRPADEILAEAHALAEAGYTELVLTGICIGDYGDERGQPEAAGDPLARLLEQLAAVPGVRRLRLSSVDPADVTPDLIKTMAALPQVCRHLHLSLQAGDDTVLTRMRRRYDTAGFRTLVADIYAAMPDAGLTCDVIVGFPGETAAQFAATHQLCVETRFCKIHAFPYSARSGTQAARWPDDVAPAEKQRRVRELSLLSERLAADFAGAQLGRDLEVLVEQRDRRTGLLQGLTGNYVRVQFPGEETLRGSVVRVRLNELTPEGVQGALL